MTLGGILNLIQVYFSHIPFTLPEMLLCFLPVENPEPNLLAMFDDRLNLVYPYFHGRKVVETAKVTSLTYVMPNSHSLFWIDEDNQLVQVNGLGKTKVSSTSSRHI